MLLLTFGKELDTLLTEPGTATDELHRGNDIVPPDTAEVTNAPVKGIDKELPILSGYSVVLFEETETCVPLGW